MAYRKRAPKSYDKKRRKEPDYKKVPMLNLRSVISFKYYLREILEDSDMKEEYKNAFVANLVTRASRGSLREAKDYIGELVEKGAIDDDYGLKICDLLDRFRKYR